MAAVADSLFSWVDPAGNTNTLDVDVVLATEDKRQARLTDHTVETGAVVTDHIVVMPESVNFELLVTQTPMGGPSMALQPLAIETETGTLEAATHAIQVRASQFRPGGFLLLSSAVGSAVRGVASLLGVGGGDPASPSSFQGSRVAGRASTVQVRTLQAVGGAPTDHVNAAHDTLVSIMNSGLLVTVSFKGRLYVDYLLTSVNLSQGKGDAGCGRFKVEARAFRTVTGVNVQLPDPADFRALPKQTKGNQPPKTPDPDPKKRGKTFAARGEDAVKSPEAANISNNVSRAFGF